MVLRRWYFRTLQCEECCEWYQPNFFRICTTWFARVFLIFSWWIAWRFEQNINKTICSLSLIRKQILSLACEIKLDCSLKKKPIYHYRCYVWSISFDCYLSWLSPSVNYFWSFYHSKFDDSSNYGDSNRFLLDSSKYVKKNKAWMV